MHIEGLRRSAAIPDILAFEIEGVASRNRGGDPSISTIRRIPPTGAWRSPGRRRHTSKGFGLDLDLVGKGQ